MITISQILQAREQVSDDIRSTPIVAAPKEIPGGEDLYLKLENMQETGSFKERGALNTVSLIKAAGEKNKIVGASAGNHAQALARHGVKLGFDVTIFMPKSTALTKILSTQKWGAKVRLEGENFDEATMLARKEAKEKGAAFVHAFDDERIIAGQGTLGLEVLSQMEGIQSVLIPVGGGGLAGGSAIALKETNPQIKVIGIQCEAYSHSYNAFHKKATKGKRANSATLADGISMKSVGEFTQPILEKYLDDIILVSEEEIASAILLLLERSKILVEGAGAVGVAALMSGRISTNGQKTLAIISGGNIDVNMMSRIIEKGLVQSHRWVRLGIQVSDRPGGLHKLTKVLKDAQANILQIQHERASTQIPLYVTGTELTLEVRGSEHLDQVLHALKEHGYHVELRS